MADAADETGRAEGSSREEAAVSPPGRRGPARLLAAVRWYLREISGAADYERYCQRHRREHPDEPLPSRRAYERLRSRQAEENTQSRCC